MAENISILVEDELNADCLLEIFSYLSLDDMMQVKNVCRNWYQLSQYWFKRVQFIVSSSFDPCHVTWELWEKNYKRKICIGSNHKKLISILHLCGHHIKYYKISHYSRCENIIDERSELIFLSVPQLCKNIVDISISDARSHPPSAYKNMAMYWRKLEELCIHYFPPTVGEDFFELLRNNKQLKTLSLKLEHKPTCPLNDEFFAHLPTTIEKIEIIFNRLYNEELKHFISASKNFTSLRVLHFEELFLSDAVALAIANITSLIHLSLCGRICYESYKTIDPIVNLKGLKSLDIASSPNLRENSLINIVESCTQLETLFLRYWEKLTDKGMAALAKLKGLKILDIHAKFVSTQSIINLCSNLEVLICHGSEMSHSDAIKVLKKATNLRLIGFYYCENLRKDTVKEARRIANERKKEIFFIGEGHCFWKSEKINEPYFKFSRDNWNLRQKLFPNDL